MLADDIEAALNETADAIDENQPLRSFDDIFADASCLTKGSHPDEVTALLKETIVLDSIQRRKVFDAIKVNNGLPMGEIRAAFSDLASNDSPELDQLALAHLVRDEIGAENIISADSFVWTWQPTGVWMIQEDRALKQTIQRVIAPSVESVDRSLVDGVTELFKNEIYMPNHEFNQGSLESVNCLNGELILNELGKWQLVEHDRLNYRTTQIPVNYNPDAQAPKFTNFLYSVFDGDPDADDKLQAVLEMIGYSLMAHCKHEKFVILLGSGANGKSVLLSVLEALIGRTNTAAVQPSQFENKFQRAHLHGKLVNIVSELKQGAVIDDDALKGITSGEATTVEHKNKDPFVMHPFSTCWFGTNHMPHTRDFSNALLRRAVLLKFNNTFSAELGNMNPNLKNELLKELEGILSMVLTAYGEASFSGFTIPQSMNEALAQWRLETDQIAQFVNDDCKISDQHDEPAKELYQAYQKWATQNGIKQQVNNRSFKERMDRLGIASEKRMDRNYYIGVKCEQSIGISFT